MKRVSFLLVLTFALGVALAPLLAHVAMAGMMGGGGGGSGGSQTGMNNMTMKGMSGYGAGTGSVSCSGSNCTQTISGTFRGMGNGNGSFSAQLDFNKAQAMDNGSGGYCYGASGTVMITAASGSTMTFDDAGLLCEVGAGSAPMTFNGSAIISSGTGNYKNAVGSGATMMGIDGSGNVFMSLSGMMGPNGM